MKKLLRRTGIALVVLALYAGAYYSTVVPLKHMAFMDIQEAREKGMPLYEVKGRIWRILFIPMYELDQRLRPDTWGKVEEPNGMAFPPWPGSK